MRVIRLDAVFYHEITTPIAINDLVARGRDKVFDSTKIKAVTKCTGAALHAMLEPEM